METFRAGIRPAVSMGLSVTRAGGAGHNKRQKGLAAQTLKILADYRQAEEFSHFGSELAVEAKRALLTGKRIFEILSQSPSDTFSLMSQQLMLDLVLNLPDGEEIDLNALKLHANEFSAQITGDDNYESVRDQLKLKCMIEIKGGPAKADDKSAENTGDPDVAPLASNAEEDKKVEEKPKEDAKKSDKKEPAEAKK